MNGARRNFCLISTSNEVGKSLRQRSVTMAAIAVMMCEADGVSSEISISASWKAAEVPSGIVISVSCDNIEVL